MRMNKLTNLICMAALLSLIGCNGDSKPRLADKEAVGALLKGWKITDSRIVKWGDGDGVHQEFVATKKVTLDEAVRLVSLQLGKPKSNYKNYFYRWKNTHFRVSLFYIKPGERTLDGIRFSKIPTDEVGMMIVAEMKS